MYGTEKTYFSFRNSCRHYDKQFWRSFRPAFRPAHPGCGFSGLGLGGVLLSAGVLTRMSARALAGMSAGVSAEMSAEVKPWMSAGVAIQMSAKMSAEVSAKMFARGADQTFLKIGRGVWGRKKRSFHSEVVVAIMPTDFAIVL